MYREDTARAICCVESFPLDFCTKTQQYSLIGHFFWFSFWCHPAALQQLYMLWKQPLTVNAASEILWAFKLALLFADVGPYEPNRSVNHPGTKFSVVKLVSVFSEAMLFCAGPALFTGSCQSGQGQRTARSVVNGVKCIHCCWLLQMPINVFTGNT